MGRGDTLLNAAIGAVVTVLTSFTVISPVLGGAVAGYLNQREGVRVGAISGVIATIPVVLLLLVASVFFVAMPMAGGMGPGGGAGPGVVGLLFVLVAFVFVLAFTVGLSALGGYLGVYVHEEDVI